MQSNNRNISLDILRIISMIGIIAIHVLGVGGVLDASNPFSTGSFYVDYWIEMLILCSVNLFALLSGFLSVNKKEYKTSRFLELISIIFFYTLIISIPFIVILYFKNKVLLSSLLAVYYNFYETYWYIMCYIPILVLQPWINRFINSLNQRQILTFNISIYIVFGLLPSLIHLDVFRTHFGYSFVWLLCCYFFGAYIRKYISTDGIKKYRKWLILITAIIPFLLLIINFFVNKLIHQIGYLTLYISPFILIEAICIFLLFVSIEIKSKSKALMLISRLSFDAYIIHCNCFIYERMGGKFAWINSLPLPVIPFAIVGVSLLIFIACILIGFIRKAIYKVCKIDVLLEKTGKYLDSKLNRKRVI